ncbi:MAG: cation-efflux pump, partial [Clostridia bacterium]|nr:cation-efflux pump [Clostridia bacterium]
MRIKMTGLIIKLFVKNSEQTENPEVRARYGSVAGITGIICNIVLFVSKLLIGTISRSVSITADAVNNLADASS